jgi:hypothetical protein
VEKDKEVFIIRGNIIGKKKIIKDKMHLDG